MAVDGEGVGGPADGRFEGAAFGEGVVRDLGEPVAEVGAAAGTFVGDGDLAGVGELVSSV
ncbi:hypothetical protein [Nocardia sp. MW-W600-9]